MMILDFSLLLSRYIFIIVNIALGNIIAAEPPQNVILRGFNTDNVLQMFVKLQLVFETYLANKYLPIWLANTQGPLKLEPLPNVMNNIGPFYMYRDVKHCAAAVYFEKRQEFDGTINNHDIIYHVPYDPENGIIMPSKSNMLRSVMNHPVRQSRTNLNNKKSGPTGVYEEEEQEKLKNQYTYYPSRAELPDTAFIETLVMVNHDMAKNLGNDYAAIVSYVLVTFNSIDALYSTVDSPKVKINIAGIIIGNGPNSFLQLNQYGCFEANDEDGKERLDILCAGPAIKFVLRDYQDIIPLESYDLVVFLTDTQLEGRIAIDYDEFTTISLGGYTIMPDEKIYTGYKSSTNDLKVIIAYNYPSAFQLYSPIAHELAHAFDVLHDQGEFRNDNGECIANLMRTDGSFCDKCLHFSDLSRTQLTRFFNSRDGCIFYNKPRSLYHPISGPQLFWSEDQQCRCYGYESSYSSLKDACAMGLFDKLWRTKSDCAEKLLCVRIENGKALKERTAYLMDGTPCDKTEKVCWNRRCEELVK